MTKTNATESQLTAIRSRAVNDDTRAIQTTGVLLTYDQADELGDEAMEWLGTRLHLRVRATDRGVECTPS